MRRGVGLLLLTLCLAAPARGTVEPGMAVFRRVQSFYEHVRDLQALFHQRVHLAIGQEQEAWGRVMLKRPGMIRWAYIGPEERLVVSDGTMMWSYVPRDKQAIVQPISQLQASSLPFDFLVGTGRLDRDFILEGFSREEKGSLFRLTVRPRVRDPHLGRLHLVVDGRTLLLKGLTIEDTSGNVTVLQFAETRVNEGLSRDLFVFTPPEGTEVLRAEEIFPAR
ncbi:MAG: outer membrane lipoprotein carrier protein LolA [Candidatus Methylomirabilales bacterium]